MEAFEAALQSAPTAELEPMLLRMLALARTHPRWATSLGACGAQLKARVALELTNREAFVTALPLLREVLSELTRELGGEHAAVATAQLNLATCLTNLGRAQEAAPLLATTLTSLTQRLGAEHEETLHATHLAASARCALGDLDGAEAVLQTCQATLARLAVAAGLAPHAAPPGKLIAWCNTVESAAQVLTFRERPEAAEPLLRSALATLAGATDSATSEARTRLTLALALVLQRRSDLLGAETIYRGLLPELQGKCNYNLVCRNLGLLLAERGLTTESRKYLDISERIAEASFGAGHLETQRSQQARGIIERSLRTCAHCGPVADAALVMKVCQGCKAARYCGPACAKLHWKAHKKTCRSIEAESRAVAAGSGAGQAAA